MTTPRRPLTIAHVTGEIGFSGGELQVFLLLEGLRKRGHHSVLLCPPESRSLREAARRGIEARPIRAGNEWSLRSMWEIRRELQASAPDLVHLHTGRANWLGGLAAWYLGPAGAHDAAHGPRREARRAHALHVRARRPARRRDLGRGARAADRRRRARGDDPPDPERRGSGAALPAARPRGDARRGRPGRHPLAAGGGGAGAPQGHRRAAGRARAPGGRGTAARALDRRSGPRPPRAREAGARAPARRPGALPRPAQRRRGPAQPPATSSSCRRVTKGSGWPRWRRWRRGVRSWPPGSGGSPRPSCTSARVCWCRPRIRRRSASALARLLRDPELRARLAAEGPARIAEGFRADDLVEAYEGLYFEVLEEAGRS